MPDKFPSFPREAETSNHLLRGGTCTSELAAETLYARGVPIENRHRKKICKPLCESKLSRAPRRHPQSGLFLFRFILFRNLNKGRIRGAAIERDLHDASRDSPVRVSPFQKCGWERQRQRRFAFQGGLLYNSSTMGADSLDGSASIPRDCLPEAISPWPSTYLPCRPALCHHVWNLS